MSGEIVKVIPAEIESIASSLPEQEKINLFSVLEKTFSETAKWRTQVDAIEVTSIDQKTEMKQLDLLRKGVKDARLKAVAFTKQKRDEVQVKMASFQIEDKVWLKVSQLIEENLKGVEKDADYKAKFADRYEAQQKELRSAERLNKCLVFDQSLQKSDVSDLSDAIFEAYLSSIEKKYNDRIEAERIAAEQQADLLKKQNQFALRRELIVSNDLIKWHKVGSINLETTEPEFEAYFSGLKEKKETYEAEQKRILEENERLREEAEQKAKKQAENDRIAKAEADRIAEENAEKLRIVHEQAEAERKKQKSIQDEIDRIAAEKLKAANEKAEKAFKEAEKLKQAARQKELDELAAKQKIENDRITSKKKAASSSDMEKLIAFKIQIESLVIPEIQDIELKGKISTLKTKYASFIGENILNLK